MTAERYLAMAERHAEPMFNAPFAMPFVMDCMPVGIGVFDHGGSLIRSNPAFTDMTMGTLASLDDMRSPAWTGFDAEGAALAYRDYPGAAALIGQMATPGHEFRYTDRLGTDYWFNVSAVPLRSPSDETPIGLALVLEDIADRKREAARLADIEDRFSAFFDNSNCGLWVADIADGRFHFLNPAALRLWPGVTGQGSLADWLGSVHPDDRARVVQQRGQVAHGQSQTLSYRLIDTAGTVVRYLRETSFPISSRAGNGPAMGGIVESVAVDLPLYLLEADPDGDGAMACWLQRAGYRVKSFRSIEALIAIADVLAPGCLLLDVRGGAFDPAAVIASMRRCSILPIVVLGKEDAIPADILEAIRAGAGDYVPGLGDGGMLETALSAARATLPAHDGDRSAAPNATADLFATLSPRETDVLKGLMEGGTNKSIARALGISPRTVEVHRARLMDRLQVKTLSALIRRAESAQAKG